MSLRTSYSCMLHSHKRYGWINRASIQEYNPQTNNPAYMMMLATRGFVLLACIFTVQILQLLELHNVPLVCSMLRICGMWYVCLYLRCVLQQVAFTHKTSEPRDKKSTPMSKTWNARACTFRFCVYVCASTFVGGWMDSP